MSDDHPSVQASTPATAKDVAALAALHLRLVDTLEELDRHKEHVAGAYVSSAIDVLEARLALDGHVTAIRPGGAVADFAARLTEELGDRAIDISRAQAERAEGEALRVWQAIVGQLERAA